MREYMQSRSVQVGLVDLGYGASAFHYRRRGGRTMVRSQSESDRPGLPRLPDVLAECHLPRDRDGPSAPWKGVTVFPSNQQKLPQAASGPQMASGTLPQATPRAETGCGTLPQATSRPETASGTLPHPLQELKPVPARCRRPLQDLKRLPLHRRRPLQDLKRLQEGLAIQTGRGTARSPSNEWRGMAGVGLRAFAV